MRGGLIHIPGGAGGLNEADNGLSLSGKKVQLGGTLTKDTSIDIEDHDLKLYSSTEGNIVIGKPGGNTVGWGTLGVGIGNVGSIAGSGGIGIGDSASVMGGISGISIGTGAAVNGEHPIAIGKGVKALEDNAITIGGVTAQGGVVSNSTADSLFIGFSSDAGKTNAEIFVTEGNISFEGDIAVTMSSRSITDGEIITTGFYELSSNMVPYSIQPIGFFTYGGGGDQMGYYSSSNEDVYFGYFDGFFLENGMHINRSGSTISCSFNTDSMGFFGATAVSKPTVTGSRGGNAALQSLLTALANLGLITNSTT